MKRFNTQTRFVPLKIDEDFNVGHIQSKDGKVKDFKTRKAVEKYCKENHCIYCEEKYTFEVGGKNKGFEQIKDIPNSYVASDDLEIGIGNKIALWIFGFLY